MTHSVRTYEDRLRLDYTQYRFHSTLDQMRDVLLFSQILRGGNSPRIVGEQISTDERWETARLKAMRASRRTDSFLGSLMGSEVDKEYVEAMWRFRIAAKEADRDDYLNELNSFRYLSREIGRQMEFNLIPRGILFANKIIKEYMRDLRLFGGMDFLEDLSFVGKDQFFESAWRRIKIWQDGRGVARSSGGILYSYSLEPSEQ